MTAATHQHPASIAIQSIMVAAHDAPLYDERLTEVARYVAALVQDTDDLRAVCTALAEDKVDLERQVASMEALDARRCLRISALKKQLGQTERAIEQFHAALATLVGDASLLLRHSETLKQLTIFDEPAQPAGVH